MQKGMSKVGFVILLAVIAGCVYLAIKYAGKPVSDIAVGAAAHGADDIKKAEAARDLMNKTDEAVKKANEAAESGK